MSTITKERVAEFIKNPLDNGLTRGEQMELARIALASLRAEPVAWRSLYYENHGLLTGSKNVLASWQKQGWKCEPLYAAPPAPVSVPDDVSGPLAHAYKELTPTFMRNHIDVFERYGIYPDGSAGIQAMRIALDGMNRRAAMLQGAEPVSQPCTLPDGYCVMPLKLTSENGAKGALSGEFHVTNRIVCQSCAGEGCEDCNDEGGWDAEIPVSWDTIKRIHEAAVEACSLPAAPQQEVKR